MTKRKPALKTLTRHANGHTYTLSIRPISAKDLRLIIDYYDATRTRHRLSTQTTDLDAAIQQANSLDLETIESQVQQAIEIQHIGPDIANPRLRDLIDYYIETWMPNRNRKPRAIQTNEGILREFELYCRGRHIGRANQLSPKLIEDYTAWLRSGTNAPATARNKIAAIRACLNAAVATELLTESPIKRWLMPNVPDPEIDPLKPHELQEVLAIITEHAPRISNIIHWIAHTGNRPSDARTLTWDQIDIKLRTVHRPQVKTARLAEYQLSDQALATLEAERHRNRPGPRNEVFTNPDGLPFTRNYLLRVFKQALRAAHHPQVHRINIKTLRHTFGYIMANYAGCPLPILQRLMGHSDIKTTMKYIRSADAQPSLERFLKVLKTR